MALIEKLLRSKIFVWTLIVLPGLWPAWPLFVTHNPTDGADPLKFLLHHFGFVACVLLAVVLTFTPLRVLWPRSKLAAALNRHRRLVGVSAFAYAALHFSTHVLYEGGLESLMPTLKVALGKPFQLVGLIALTILLVLAVTSVPAAIRWLGGKRWKNLHRLAYLAAGLSAYHQAAARKIFPQQVLWIFGPLIVLEVLRVMKERKAWRPVARPPAPTTV